jgi:hypothetical protein
LKSATFKIIQTEAALTRLPGCNCMGLKTAGWNLCVPQLWFGEPSGGHQTQAVLVLLSMVQQFSQISLPR